MRTLLSLTGVAAATLSLSACAPYPDEPGDAPPAAGCPAYKARDFKAWIDTMPGPGARPTLHITGEVDMPTPGYSVKLVAGPADRMQPPGWRFQLDAKKPNGMVTQVITPTPVRFDGPTPYPQIREIIITCGGEALARIEDVPVVQ